MAAHENPRYTANLRYLAAGLAALGRLQEARAVAEKLLQLQPDFRLSEFERTLQPFRVPEIRDRYIDHLKKAGLPE
jgi:adenylate cyclase